MIHFSLVELIVQWLEHGRVVLCSYLNRSSLTRICQGLKLAAETRGASANGAKLSQPPTYPCISSPRWSPLTIKKLDVNWTDLPLHIVKAVCHEILCRTQVLPLFTS